LANDFTRPRNNCHYKKKSEDQTINVFGRCLLDMCVEFSLIILKGIYAGDITGCYTFISPNGNSVNDYFIVSDDFMNMFDNFDLKVHSNVESWHMPISLCIKLNNNFYTTQTQATTKTYEKIIWDNGKCQSFKNKIESNEFSNQLSELLNSLETDFNEAASKFTSLFTDAANVMKKIVKIDLSSQHSPITWFDNECLNFKKSLRLSLNRYRKEKS
jgi:hypothetical protein